MDETRASAAPGVGASPALPALVGLVSLGLACAAHVLSGGVLPGLPILCGLAALSALAATVVARLELPGWAVMLALGAAQQMLHWLLGGLAGAASSSTGSGDHHGAAVPVGGTATAGHSPEIMLMLHTHLAVALLIGWVVVRAPQLARWMDRRRTGRTADAEEGAPV